MNPATKPRAVEMVTTTSTPTEEGAIASSSIILKNVKWLTYKTLMADVGDDRAWRIAYDRGVLEIRMPLVQHEVPKRLIEDFVTAVADELEIEIMSVGSLLLERSDLARAIEPDTCFYIQNEALVRERNDIELPNDPPPDLAVESDYTNSSVNKDSLYAALGVPEIWRYKNRTLLVYRLVEYQYELSEQSLAFPFLPIAEIPSFIEQSKTIGQRSAVRAFRSRIREILAEQNSQ